MSACLNPRLRKRTILGRVSAVLNCPMNSSMIFSLLPAAAMRAGVEISVGM